MGSRRLARAAGAGSWAWARDAEPSAGFRTWCEASGSPFVWPPRRLTMTESQSVQGGFLPERRFAVNDLVEPSGEVGMPAPCEAGGGGITMPRTCFHEDTEDKTGRIHVGFVGPHREVPTASTD